ncbi:RNA-binding protein 41 [Sphaeramia orbicularis]|uniref:RNA-binding protein 41 n=1 Tax=Sphaeramia orbicularis TaxID=375764 RepID=UPI00117ED0B4|nr:RNA-binding protein 41-like [Sphaeramia orbicularis]XP_030010564.1 RNA-binding protein 41-like [Sphaeramia orbicularis]XP_030010565.1 RNA-binding protein 41-like [Sphaeramia orbicularis]
MRRVSRQSCEDGPLLEEQETEGRRQLHNLLLQQLHTNVNIDKCVAKRQCFAPAALYRPFGEQAAGVQSLSQFQALQDGQKELDGLRELGLTDAEIQLWQSRDDAEAANKAHGVCAAPGARQERLQVIRDKIEARAQLLSRPQRFATSRPLSRREMEIERALFQGSDRFGFLTALYHQGADEQAVQQGASSCPSMDSVYRTVLSEDRAASPHRPQQDASHLSTDTSASDQSQTSTGLLADSQRDDVQPEAEKSTGSGHFQSNSDQWDELKQQPLATPTHINISQPIGSLCGAGKAGSNGPLTVRGEIESISDEEILSNREPDEGIRSIARFRNYHPGKPSKVLCVKNLSAQASVAQLVALFCRFEEENDPQILYRLLTGRMKGQAFITLRDAETAQKALELVHGYRLLGKPLVVEFGRERQEEEKQKEDQVQKEENSDRKKDDS